MMPTHKRIRNGKFKFSHLQFHAIISVYTNLRLSGINNVNNVPLQTFTAW